MPLCSLRHKAVFLLLAAFLATPWSLGAVPQREAVVRPTAAAAPALLGWLWTSLVSTWRGSAGLGGVHSTSSSFGLTGSSSCSLDPNSCAASYVAIPSDEGCRIDPSGCGL